MEAQPKTTELAISAGISKSYASEILAGKRVPSRALAIHIFRKVGWRHETIAALTAEQIDVLEQVDPWQAKQAAA